MNRIYGAVRISQQQWEWLRHSTYAGAISITGARIFFRGPARVLRFASCHVRITTF